MSKDDSTIYSVQKRFIDYAADMHWEYCLIDANWDTTIGYGKVKDLSDYAARKNVGILLWVQFIRYMEFDHLSPQEQITDS